uniref:Putative secreted peptide n=1 Tax=Anopheles braziliensis TaxID=58242 RepID=A0A2M3ZQS6_9DIPT
MPRKSFARWLVTLVPPPMLSCSSFSFKAFTCDSASSRCCSAIAVFRLLSSICAFQASHALVACSTCSSQLSICCCC